MTQIVKRAIQNNAVDGDKIKLLNNQSIRGTKADGSEVALFKLDNADKWVFETLPKFGGSDVATKQHVSDEILVEAAARATDVSVLNGKVNVEKARIDVIAPKVTTLEGQMTTAQGQITSLQGADTTLNNRITSEVATLDGKILTEKTRAESAEASLGVRIDGIASGLQWRQKVFLISQDAEMKTAIEGDLLSAILPFGDDETPIFDVAAVPVGSFLVSENGASSKIMKVILDGGVKKVSFVGVEALADGDTFVVEHDLLDTPGTRETQAIYSMNASGLLKVADFDFSLASGIDISGSYASIQGESVLPGDSVEAAIGKVEGQIGELAQASSDAVDNANEALARLAVVEPKVSTLEGQFSTLQSITIPQINSILQTHGMDINTIQTNIIPTLDSRILNQEGRVQNLEMTLIPSLDFRLVNQENKMSLIETIVVPQLDSRVFNAEGKITTLEGKVSTLELIDVPQIKSRLMEIETVGLPSKIDLAEKGMPNGVATLDFQGKVPATQLPSYVDDVLEFADLASFPASGELGKIYVAADTNKTYRWSGSVYVYITSGAVDSVNGLTGVVSLNTSLIPEVTNLYYTQGRFDSALAAKSTSNLTEGTNLYWTTSRFDTRLASKSTSDIAEGSNLYYTQARFDSALAVKTTSNLTEGSNLYFSDARAKLASVVNTLSGSETDKAPSVQATKDYIAAAASKIFAPIFTLTAGQISQGYVELADQANVILDVTPKGFVSQFEGDDYFITVVGGKTRVNFMGDMLSLAEGDKVKVVWAK
jgi:hypothetical protein